MQQYLPKCPLCSSVKCSVIEAAYRQLYPIHQIMKLDGIASVQHFAIAQLKRFDWSKTQIWLRQQWWIDFDSIQSFFCKATKFPLDANAWFSCRLDSHSAAMDIFSRWLHPIWLIWVGINSHLNIDPWVKHNPVVGLSRHLRSPPYLRGSILCRWSNRRTGLRRCHKELGFLAAWESNFFGLGKAACGSLHDLRSRAARSEGPSLKSSPLPILYCRRPI